MGRVGKVCCGKMYSHLMKNWGGGGKVHVSSVSACVEVWILCCAHVSVGFIASSLQFIFDSSHDIKFEKIFFFFFCILASFGEMKLTSHHSLNQRQKLEIHAFFFLFK